MSGGLPGIVMIGSWAQFFSLSLSLSIYLSIYLSICGLWPLTFHPTFCTYTAHRVEAALSLLRKRITRALEQGGLACEGVAGCDHGVRLEPALCSFLLRPLCQPFLPWPSVSHSLERATAFTSVIHRRSC